MTESGDSKTTSESYNFWGTDETLAYSALKSLYKSLKDPTSLKLKDITCITYDSRLGSGEEITTRAAVITYYAANSFGGMVKNQYAYESRSNGTVYDGDYDYITPYRVLQGDYRDVHAIENAQDILSRVEKEYWGK